MYLKKQNFPIESIIIALIIGGLSLTSAVDFSLPAAPVLICIAALFLSFWLGRREGLLFLILAMALYLTGGYLRFAALPPWREILYLFCTAAVLVYLGGALKKFRQERMDKVLSRYRKGSEKRTRLSRISKAQQDIIRELEERVTRQKTSPNILYDKIKEIDCLDSAQSLSRLLDTIVHFTEAEALSLWIYDQGENRLKLRMRRGEEESSSDDLDLQDSIEGWVFRNNQLFSMRMTLDYENLEKLNREQCIISAPVVVDNRTWGVITIEELPFIKYSEYTENIMQIIISLAQPALKKALDFENILLGEEQHELTGLPQFTQLYRILDQQRFDEAAGFNSCSLILFDFLNLKEMAEELGRERTLSLQAELMKEIADQASGSAEIFHYREEQTMAIFIPYMDYDGCSLFCLETLELINGKQWKIRDELISPEINLGYASSGTSEKIDPDDLTKRAEYLLEIQRI